jgi:chorismate-pyruvate lyase
MGVLFENGANDRTGLRAFDDVDRGRQPIGRALEPTGNLSRRVDVGRQVLTKRDEGEWLVGGHTKMMT